MREMIRTFIAVEISCQIKAVLGGFIANCKTCRADVKWVRPENLHVTLKFLGDISENDVVKISEIIRECSSDIKPFDLTIEGVVDSVTTSVVNGCSGLR